MWQAIGKYVGGKVLTAILMVLAAGCVIWAWRHPEELRAIGHVLKYLGIWLGIAVVLPWTILPLVPWVVKKESNLVSAGFLAGVTAIDVLVALYLAGFSGHGALTWMVLLLGFLTAAAYNFVVCNHQANRVEDAL